MVKLRLKRAGRKGLPIYKIVAADARYPRDGRFIEQVGYYDPNKNPMQVDLVEDRVMYWLKTGAQPTDTVRSLFKREGILYKWNLEKRGKSAEEIQSELENFKTRNADRHVKDEEKKARRKENKAKKEAEAKLEAEGPKVEAAPEVKAEETPEVKEVKEEAAPVVEAAPEVKEEAPVAEEKAPEVKEETPEVKEEVKAEETAPEVKEEEAPEVKDEEVKEEETKEEVKEETKEETTEENKDEEEAK